MSVRAKFVCESKTEINTEGHGEVNLRPVHSGSPENEEFFNMTPGGAVQLRVVNPAAMALFEKGKEYYVDFTPAE